MYRCRSVGFVSKAHVLRILVVCEGPVTDSLRNFFLAFSNLPTEAMALHEVLFEQFVKAHPRPPKRIVLDFDATDIPLHGMQEGRH